jgi:rubredoxin-NAD+ reductase
MDPIVIVGSGLAGYTVAREFRRKNASEPLIVITADDGQFYSKPALSEALRLGTPDAELASRDAQAMQRQIKGDIWCATRAERVDTEAKTLFTSAGTLHYSRLVLALGAEPGQIPLDPISLGHIHSVNDLASYLRFRTALHGKRSVTVLGAGLVGCEFANDLARGGYHVTVVDLAPLPLSRLLPPLNGAFLRQGLERIGVEWWLGAGITAIERDGGGLSVHVVGGDVIRTDVVLSAIGLRPRTSLLRDTRIHTGHGIKVDTHLRTSDRDVFALGDCAEVQGIWLPYIGPIAPAARVIASNLNGGSATVRYPAMPVIVKTPDCPTVVCLPPPGLEGQWRTESSDQGVQSLFQDVGGAVHGFALNGSHVVRAPELRETLPMLLG